jgi:hypothetical protein
VIAIPEGRYAPARQTVELVELLSGSSEVVLVAWVEVHVEQTRRALPVHAGTASPRHPSSSFCGHRRCFDIRQDLKYLCRAVCGRTGRSVAAGCGSGSGSGSGSRASTITSTSTSTRTSSTKRGHRLTMAGKMHSNNIGTICFVVCVSMLMFIRVITGVTKPYGPKLLSLFLLFHVQIVRHTIDLLYI